MRIQLIIQKGCMKYKCIKIVDGPTHDTFPETYYALRLLEDGKVFIYWITESSVLGLDQQLCTLFLTLLTLSIMTHISVAWDATWQLLLDDIPYE
jgi:hypothetical protein